MQTLNGYIKIYRKLVRWGWYKNSVVKDTFLHCLFMANFTDQPFEGTVIKKGQFVTSYENLASELGFTTQKVRTAIKKLKSTGEITTKSTNKFTIITVVNWEIYQGLEENPTSKITSTLTNEQQTTNNQITNKQQTNNNNVRIIRNKEYKECKEREEDIGTSSSSESESYPQTMGGTIGKGVLILTDEQMGKLLDMMPLGVFDKYCDKLSSWIKDKGRKVDDHYGLIVKWYNEDYGG